MICGTSTTRSRVWICGSSRMSSSQCQFQTQSQCQTSIMSHRSRLVSALSRCHRSSRTLSQSLCQRRSLCTSHHHQHHALLHTPSTRVLQAPTEEQPLTEEEPLTGEQAPTEESLEVE